MTVIVSKLAKSQLVSGHFVPNEQKKGKYPFKWELCLQNILWDCC